MTEQSPGASGRSESLFCWIKQIDPDKESIWETDLIVAGVPFVFKNSPNRKRTRIAAYFSTRSEAEELKKRWGGGVSELSPEHWKPCAAPAGAHFVQIRDRFVVTETDDPEALQELEDKFEGREILSFPPRLAFGTGRHPTTAGCLRLLTDAAGGLPHSRQHSWNFLDLGCGSGILSVAAAKLGAQSVRAVDIDKTAVSCSHVNASRHGTAEQIRFQVIDVIGMLQTHADEQFEVVAANLYSELLIQTLPELTSWLAPHGVLIVSGFLAGQAKAVTEAAERAGFHLEHFLRRGKWVAASTG